MHVLLPLALALTCNGVDHKPNVLLLAIDDLNDWVGCMDGHAQADTPNIDRLAEGGMLFTNAHCQAPICGPSRASLLSGRYPHTTGVYVQPRKGLEQDKRYFDGHMMPQVFARHGYKTMGVGKIHHGFTQSKSFQVNGPKASSGPKPPQAHRFNYHLPDVPYSGTQTDWGVFPDVDAKMPDFKTATWAIEQLQQEHDRPFFLAVGFIRPHVPFYTTQEWFDKFPLNSIELPAIQTDDLDDIPEIGKRLHALPKYPKLSFLMANENLQFKKCVQAYLACTAFVDHQVGRVLDALAASDHAKDTIVVLFSDHGYHLGEKNRVSKHGLWEEAVRVPFIIRLPGDTDGKECIQPVGLIDLYPTLLELTGLPARDENEGASLVPLLKNPEANWRHAVLTTYARRNHSLRSKRFRYIRYEDGSEELYDHGQDPHEWRNLAGDPQYSQIKQRFQKLLPEENAPYHARQSSNPINAWFQKHLAKNGVK